MRIIAHLEGTVVIKSPWEELRPPAGTAVPLVMSALQARYKFTNVGFSAVSQQASMFTPHLQLGGMLEGSESFSINSIEFQPPLFVVVSSTTSYAEIFIRDMFSFLKEHFGFREPPENRPRHCRSSIVFQPSDIDIDAAMGKWNEVLAFLNPNLSKDTSPYRTLGIRFSNEEFGIANEGITTSTPFIIERRLGAPLGENWWFSQAPVDTETHLALLEKIEKTFQ
jgi:hypothetical protein